MIKGFIKGTNGPNLNHIIDYGYVFDMDEDLVKKVLKDLFELNYIEIKNGRYYPKSNN